MITAVEPRGGGVAGAAYKGTLTVVCADEVGCLRGVVDELDFVDLPHLNSLFTKLLDKNTRINVLNDP